MKKLHLPLLFCLFAHQIAFSQEITQIGYVQSGKASYYSDDRKGAVTRSGERYDPTALEAAHAAIAFNSLVKITNIENGKETIVRINDRPFASERIIDMTKTAADALGMTEKKTVIDVKIEIIQLGVARNNAREILADAYRRIATQPSQEVEEITKEEEISARYEGERAEDKGISEEINPKKDDKITKEKAAKEKLAQEKKLADTKNKKNKGVLSGNSKPIAKNKNNDKVSFDPTHTYTTDGEKISLGGFGVQVGSYDDADKALKQVPVLEKLKLGQVYIQAGWAAGKKTYRVLIGNFKTRELAQKMAEKLNKKNYKSFPKKHFD
jgi:rare lipoprotein A